MARYVDGKGSDKLMKRFISVCILLLCFLLSLSVSAHDSSKKLDYTSELDSDKLYKVTSISDNKYTSSLTVDPGETLRLYADSPKYLHVKFYGNAPGQYTLTLKKSDGSTEPVTMHVGKNSFLHDLTQLDYDADIIEITSGEQIKIAELELYSHGKLPDNVQRWENTFSACDILVISTHSDDDTLFFGALIAENTAKNRLVQTAFITNHSNELHRLNEMLDGQWALGITAYPIVGDFKDLYSTLLETAKSQYDTDAMTGFIVECIRRTRPLVLVTHDVNGEYGHGAHMLVSKLTRESLDLCAEKDAYIESAKKYGVHSPEKTYIHLYKENEIILDVDAEYDSLVNKSPFETAREAYKCHISQQKWSFKVTKTGTDDCRRFGLYRSYVNCDVASNDVMNGLSPVLPSVLSTTMMNKSEKMEEAKTNVTFVEAEENNFELLSLLFNLDKIETKVPMHILAVCILITALLLVFVLFKITERIRRP